MLVKATHIKKIHIPADEVSALKHPRKSKNTPGSQLKYIRRECLEIRTFICNRFLRLSPLQKEHQPTTQFGPKRHSREPFTTPALHLNLNTL